MALHFSPDEFDRRKGALLAAMAQARLDGLLLFQQESMYWATGYDTFGFCFFQCLVVAADGRMALLTRSADLRQARHTSIIADVRIWKDAADANPALDLKDLCAELGLAGKRLGVEFESYGLVASNGRKLEAAFDGFAPLADASHLVTRLRAVKSAEEIAHVRRAAALANEADAAALAHIRAGADEGDILAAQHAAIFRGGGDYPANEFIIGSGADALLCRYKAGRRKLDAQDQLTLEWAGVSAHYHAAMMRTIVVGEVTNRHRELYSACRETIQAIEMVLRPGNTFGTVFDVHAKIMDERGLARHRLNACGYSLGARFSPSWMEQQMFHIGNPQEILPDMSLFLHMIIMDSDSGTAMTLGQTYITTDGAPKPLSRYGLDFITA